MRNRFLLTASVAGAVIALASCAGPTGPSTPFEPYTDMPGSASLSLAPKKLAVCKPLPAATQSATIGFLGGTINIGPHTLWIPPGAVSGTRTITATIVANDSSNSVQFKPEGLKFAVPGLINMSYANCNKTSLLQPAQVVFTSDDLLQILELLPSIDNPYKKTSLGTIRHFSRYAIAY